MDRFFRRKTDEPARVTEPARAILPEDVRYALAYKNSLLGKEEIEMLARNGFLEEACYLTFKSLVGSPIEHRAFLEKYLSCFFKREEDREDALRKLINETLRDRDDVSIKGGKLAQLSRQGFDLWQEKFQSLAEKLSSDDRNIFLVAHSTFVGLAHFLKAFSEKRKTLNILIPEWIKSKEVGYVLNFDGNKINIDWLHVPFENGTGSILLDDTLNTGNTLQQLQGYLIENGLQHTEIMSINKTL